MTIDIRLILLLIFSIVLFTFNLDRLPHPDELHHVLAAEGVLRGGTPAIAEGLYHRGYFYTKSVAASFHLFGVSPLSARLPSVLASLITIAIFYAFLTRAANRRIGLLACVLLITNPFFLELVQMSRFYAYQILMVVTASASLYILLNHRPASLFKTAMLLLLAVASSLAALNIQITSAFFLAGLSAWLVLRWHTEFIQWLGSSLILRIMAGVLLALVLAAGIAIIINPPSFLLDALAQFRASPLFLRERHNDVLFYLRYLGLLYGPFMLVIIWRWRRIYQQHSDLVLLCTLIVVCGVVLNSLAATKAMRYAAYIHPFLMLLAALTLMDLWHNRKHLWPWAWPETIPRRQAGGFVVIILVLLNPFWIKTVGYLLEQRLPFEATTPDWPLAKTRILAAMEDADVIITTEELATLYYIGDYDIRFSPSKIGELPAGQKHDFGRDFRTGRPVIGSLQALKYLIHCQTSGLIVGSIEGIGQNHLLSDAIWSYILEHTMPYQMPENSYIFARTWSRPAADDEQRIGGVCLQYDWMPRSRD